MHNPDRERMNDSLISDEQYRQALRNFANADHESLQNQGEDIPQEPASISAEE